MGININNKIDAFCNTYYDRKVQKVHEKWESETERMANDEIRRPKKWDDSCGLTLSEEGIRLSNQRSEPLAGIYWNTASFSYHGEIQNVSEDPFEVEQVHRWAVFDDYLECSGFFEGMDAASRNELAMTMDSMLVFDYGWGEYRDTGIGIGELGIRGRFLDSYEAEAAMESSIAGLEFFSEKYLSGECKEGFDALIDRYHNKTKDLLQGYRSYQERLFDSASAHKETLISEDEMRRYGASEAQVRQRRYGLILAEVKHTQAETNSYRNMLKQIFSGMGKDNQAEKMAQAVECMVKYATGNSADPNVANYVRGSSKDVFDHMQASWNRLLEWSPKGKQEKV